MYVCIYIYTFMHLNICIEVLNFNYIYMNFENVSFSQ